MRINPYLCSVMAAVALVASCEGPVDPTRSGDATSSVEARTAATHRIAEVQRAIVSGKLPTDRRPAEIAALVQDVERLNAGADLPTIEIRSGRSVRGEETLRGPVAATDEAALFTMDPELPRHPPLPTRPCLLLPCDDVKVSNGWICFKTGSYCTPQGAFVCTYTCFRVTGP